MIDINGANKEIFKLLQDYITSNSRFNPYVMEMQIDKKYPCVIFHNNSNKLGMKTQDRVYQTRKLSFEIEIYAINQGQNDSIEICEELEQLINEVMIGTLGIQGGTDGKVFNANSDKATYFILHFSCEWFPNKNILY